MAHLWEFQSGNKMRAPSYTWPDFLVRGEQTLLDTLFVVIWKSPSIPSILHSLRELFSLRGVGGGGGTLREWEKGLEGRLEGRQDLKKGTT